MDETEPNGTDMSNLIIKSGVPQPVANPREKLTSGEIQARVDLQALARVYLGNGMPGGDCISYYSPFDPDDMNGSFQVFPGYYRDVRNGDRGGAIKFIQKVRRCSCDQAVAYLEGWLHGQGVTL